MGVKYISGIYSAVKDDNVVSAQLGLRLEKLRKWQFEFYDMVKRQF
jgi:hypothetical protein